LFCHINCWVVVVIVKRVDGKPIKIWLGSIKNDLTLLEIDENLTPNRTQCRRRIHVADPT